MLPFGQIDIHFIVKDRGRVDSAPVLLGLNTKKEAPLRSELWEALLYTLP